MDEQRLQQLELVNREVNTLIMPAAREPGMPWDDDATVGDCNDYTLQKRSKLLDLKFPASALLLAVAIVPGGEGHLVLVVATDRGDLVLDNLRDEVVRWDTLPYRWIKRSSPEDPGTWKLIEATDRAWPMTNDDEG